MRPPQRPSPDVLAQAGRFAPPLHVLAGRACLPFQTQVTHPTHEHSSPSSHPSHPPHLHPSLPFPPTAEGKDVSFDPDQAQYPSYLSRELDNVISVAATKEDDSLTPWSNYGRWGLLWVSACHVRVFVRVYGAVGGLGRGSGREGWAEG